MSSLQAIVSIHDVMPHTLDKVEGILARLAPACRARTVLLIVPGLPWEKSQLELLRRWRGQGLELAGHGWTHRAASFGGLYHRLHSAALSRRAAEHLSLDQAGIASLMRRNHRWFKEQDLGEPELYVPPAWAMGPVSRRILTDSPFRYFETTAGFYDSRKGRQRYLPLAGFEADTAWRRHSLAAWNRLNATLSSPARPLRLSIHPNDFSLRLASQLNRLLEEIARTVDYRSLFD